MRTWAALAVFLTLCVPATAQPPGEVELLELEQDVDKTLLREAMLNLGRLDLKQATGRDVTDGVRKRDAADAEALKQFIAEKKHAFSRRSDVLKEKRAESAKAAAQQRVATARRAESAADEKERQGLIEKLEEAQIEVQLLQMQINLLQQPLNEAVQAAANAEFAAGNDATKKGEAEAARERLNKARERYVGVSKRLQMEQSKMSELQTRLGSGGMGGGFR
jgi:hypothetical protein